MTLVYHSGHTPTTVKWFMPQMNHKRPDVLQIGDQHFQLILFHAKPLPHDTVSLALDISECDGKSNYCHCGGHDDANIQQEIKICLLCTSATLYN